MSRRLFTERGFDVDGRVLPYESFRPFHNAPAGLNIQSGHYNNLINTAEQVIKKEIPQLIASDYMMFRRNGNRNIYEGKMFSRRIDLFQLVMAEYVDKKGRFMDRIIDLVWLILEETTWVIPASNPDKVEGIEDPLPYAYKGDPDFIDLFTASTGGVMAWVYYLLKSELDEVTPIISERIKYELERRMIRPFMDPKSEPRCHWMGVAGNAVNNWNPLIISNVLTVCALVVDDTELRERLVARAMPMLDNFTRMYYDDGGCDEGPGYWGVAGACLFDCLQLLYDMTGGYVNLYDDPLVKKMGEYVVKVYINGNRFLNFADCRAKVEPDPALLLRWGKECSSEMMTTYAESKLGGALPSHLVAWSFSYRYVRNLTEPVHPANGYVAPTKFYLDGILVAGIRESSCTDKGLYVAIKGGHNNESHNHNDVGNFVVFADGQPIFLDAGSGVYTRRTFSPERYTIWSMRSEYHNCATVNGYDQPNGGIYRSTDHIYNEDTGSFSMQLKNAYPKEAGINSYTRKAELQNGVVTVTDELELEGEGTVAFNYLCNTLPENVTDTSFDVHGRTVRFSKGYNYTAQELDCTFQEVECIPRMWDCKVLYRITLTPRSKFHNTKFVMTVS